MMLISNSNGYWRACVCLIDTGYGLYSLNRYHPANSFLGATNLEMLEAVDGIAGGFQTESL